MLFRITFRCRKPNAWFHWSFQINSDINYWAAAYTALDYKITIPNERGKPAFEIYRRTDTAMDFYMLLIGGILTALAVLVTRWAVKNNDRFKIITKGSL